LEGTSSEFRRVWGPYDEDEGFFVEEPDEEDPEEEPDDEAPEAPEAPDDEAPEAPDELDEVLDEALEPELPDPLSLVPLEPLLSLPPLSFLEE
jgi:hypothetical protein